MLGCIFSLYLYTIYIKYGLYTIFHDGICLPSFIIRYYTQSLKEAWKIWEKNLKLNQSVEDENIKNNLQKLLCSSKLW